jgi:hypothetical protein
MCKPRTPQPSVFFFFFSFTTLAKQSFGNYKFVFVAADVSFFILKVMFNISHPNPCILQKMPRWWAWGYWICPISWSLKGLLASQYGDIEAEITAYGERKSISSFLRSYFGYKQDDLGVVAIVLLAFPVFFALAFAITIAKLNFQKR